MISDEQTSLTPSLIIACTEPGEWRVMYVCAGWYRLCLFLWLFYWVLELLQKCRVFYSFYSNWNSNSYSNLTFKSIDIPVLSNQNQIILGDQTNVQMWRLPLLMHWYIDIMNICSNKTITERDIIDTIQHTHTWPSTLLVRYRQ
jgi:hypothetical protein